MSHESNATSYSGTTSDGHPTQPLRAKRKIKPPSASFLKKSNPVPENSDPTQAPEASKTAESPTPPAETAAAPEPAPQAEPAPEAAQETVLGAPVQEAPEISFAPPSYEGEPAEDVADSEPPRPAEESAGGPPPPSSDVEAEFAGPAPGTSTASGGELPADRTRAELQELTALVNSFSGLKFLKPRLEKCRKEGADAATLLSFYRLTANALRDDAAQNRRMIETMKGRLSKKEMELAVAAMAATPATGSVSAKAAAVAAADSERTKELEEKIESMEAQREKLLQDFQNMRNRAQMDIDLKVFKSVEKFANSLLPALDAFNQAMPSLRTSTDTDSIVTGIEMIYDQLSEALEKAGLSKIDAVGEPFDPKYHEAIGEVPTQEMEDDVVFDQYQPGYMFGERLLRPAIVRVARNDSGVVIKPGGEAEAPAEEQEAAEKAPEEAPPEAVEGASQEAPPAPAEETPETPAAEAEAAASDPEPDPPETAETPEPVAPQDSGEAAESAKTEGDEESSSPETKLAAEADGTVVPEGE